MNRTYGTSQPDATCANRVSNTEREEKHVGAEEPNFMEAVNKMADAMGLTGEDRDQYIEQHATKRGGFKKVVTWVPDTEGGKKEGDKGGSRGWWTPAE